LIGESFVGVGKAWRGCCIEEASYIKTQSPRTDSRLKVKAARTPGGKILEKNIACRRNWPVLKIQEKLELSGGVIAGSYLGENLTRWGT